MSPKTKTREIVAAFQRYLSTSDTKEINGFSLKELRFADEQLGLRDANAGFRLAIQNQIKDIELQESRKHERKIRAWNLVTGILIGLVVSGLSAWLFKT